MSGDGEVPMAFLSLQSMATMSVLESTNADPSPPPDPPSTLGPSPSLTSTAQYAAASLPYPSACLASRDPSSCAASRVATRPCAPPGPRRVGRACDPSSPCAGPLRGASGRHHRGARWASVRAAPEDGSGSEVCLCRHPFLWAAVAVATARSQLCRALPWRGRAAGSGHCRDRLVSAHATGYLEPPFVGLTHVHLPGARSSSGERRLASTGVALREEAATVADASGGLAEVQTAPLPVWPSGAVASQLARPPLAAPSPAATTPARPPAASTPPLGFLDPA
uniref:Uncharacterized protein n=1 Tax=Setaria viridis TaxID=4556 RepID=A0A4V6Y884_SETVI|nr:hypothetical protein SEVIR_6G218700v2 [Setaria viridis]